jgi:hypothetical protein
VFAGMIPCISGGTAVHDPNHPCHTSRNSPASATFGGATLRTAAAGRAHPGRRLICTFAA